MAGRILVGTSSWADPGFVKEWYPPRMTPRERLPWYAQRFEAVELNSSFYAIPDRNTVHGWVEVTPDDFVFDVKVHRALSRHAAPVESLPPDMRDGVEIQGRGRVRLTPELEIALAERVVEETAPLAEAGKLGAYLLQLTPAFAPGRNRLDELDRLVEAFAPHRLAIELRHRGWVRDKRRDETLGWFSEHDVAFVCVDAPPGDHVPIMPSDLDAVTSDDLAYLRLHGRNTDGYLTGALGGRALRLALHGRRARRGGGAGDADGRAGGRGARGLQQQPRRRRPDGRPALSRAARPGPARRGTADALASWRAGAPPSPSGARKLEPDPGGPARARHAPTRSEALDEEEPEAAVVVARRGRPPPRRTPGPCR